MQERQDNSKKNMKQMSAIMIVNISGCYLIGLAYFCIEGVMKKDLSSPLKNAPLANSLVDKGWWPEQDPTQPVFRTFKDDLRADLTAGFVITGQSICLTLQNGSNLLTSNGIQGVLGY